MHILGIDYGSKKVGIAISDEEEKFAFPKIILPNDLTLTDKIREICEEEKVASIVLGESTDLSGKKNKIMGSIEEFKKNLEGEMDLPVYYEKEFMTSLFARRGIGKLINNARKIKNKKDKKIDDSAAALILQRFLDKQNNK
ncbi:MAG TPA: Holliday junction resolvase RuvX [Candidatus Paceibacterota bacterium]|nr:Holliday junction resolvase RuvX [Candidatus Paceibacterota bacterium]